MEKKKRREVQSLWQVWLDPEDQLKLGRILDKLKITEGTKSEKLRTLIRSLYLSFGV